MHSAKAALPSTAPLRKATGFQVNRPHSNTTARFAGQVPALSKVWLCTTPVRAQDGARCFVSIRFRLLLLVLGTVFLPALLVGGRYYQDRSKEIDAAIDGLAATARTIASNFDAKIQGTIQLHFGLSRASDLAAGNKAACSSFLSEVREKNPQYTGILTIAPDGSLFCDSLQHRPIARLARPQIFPAGPEDDGTAVIEPVFGRLTGSAVLQIAYPARDEAQQSEIRAAGVARPQPADRRSRSGTCRRGAKSCWPIATGWCWTGHRRRPGRTGAAHRSPTPSCSALPRKIAGETRELRGADGETQVWAAADTLPIGGVNLHIMVGRPKAQLVAAPNRRLAQDATVLGIVSILLFACVSLFAEFGIRSQIARIAKMAARLGAGDLAARVPPPYPRGELGSLMLVLNHTASSLEIAAARHRGSQRATAAFAGTGGGRQAAARYRRQQHDPGPDPVRRVGTRRDLQPAIHRHAGPVARRGQAGLHAFAT